ncbi:hypothetical protein ACOSP7_007384 [Xanthoceras sorbifolium]
MRRRGANLKSPLTCGLNLSNSKQIRFRPDDRLIPYPPSLSRSLTTGCTQSSVSPTILAVDERKRVWAVGFDQCSQTTSKCN